MGLTQVPSSEIAAWEKRLPKACLVERDQAILELCNEKAVLHLGAANSPFHKEAAARGELLHQKLREVARTLVGIDLDSQAVDFLREHCGIDDILSGDACAVLDHPALKQRFDLVLCCDIVEHVDNPGALLESCKRFMGPDTLLILTTINAPAVKLGLRALLGREAVHQDHVAYYSYGTLCALLDRRGLRPSGVGFFCYPARSVFSKLLFVTLARYAPACADGIFLTCKLLQARAA